MLASDQRQLAEWGYVALTRARHGTRIPPHRTHRHPATSPSTPAHAAASTASHAP
ncbi:MAG: hypothetical protein U0Y82_15020 [Thermoleophilia bacterium]